MRKGAPVAGTSMVIVVTALALQRLQQEIDGAVTDPYLLTVTGDNRPHCSSSPTVGWDGSRLLVSAPSGWQASEAHGRHHVTLLWPPAETGGYSLIVDGTAAAVDIDEEIMLALTLTRAVLHRRGDAAAPTNAGCGSDCIPIIG